MTDDAGTEAYTHGYSEEMRRLHAARTAAVDAAFLVPHLRPGMRLLDAGCGPGSITVDFAALVAPGEVVGLDLAEEQLAAARALAARRGVGNVRFERGDIYALPYPDASFDAAFAHNVLEHLRDQAAALRELRRVLRPGGVVGILDGDWGALLFEPSTPLRRRAWELVPRVVAHNGGDFCYARHQRRLLREAGFARTEGHAVAEVSGTPATTRRLAAAGAQQFRDPAFVATVVEQGWADRATLEAMAADFEAWGEESDAYSLFMNPAALGWVGDG